MAYGITLNRQKVCTSIVEAVICRTVRNFIVAKGVGKKEH